MAAWLAGWLAGGWWLAEDTAGVWLSMTGLHVEAQAPAYALGALLAAGGVFGFAKSRSRPSLAAGCVLGTGFYLSGRAIGASSFNVP